MLTLYYEARFGLARGAVYRDGLPHLYLEGYEHDPSPGILGTHLVARVTKRAGGMVFLTLPGGDGAVLDGSQTVLDRLKEGVAVEAVIVAEARRDKLARARWLGPAEDEPRRLSPVLDLKTRLLDRARAAFGNVAVVEASDREALDVALDQACEPSGPLTGGGDLSIEATRALIACDVDTAGEGGVQTSRAFAKACNERAVADLPRRLRLSNLAGLVVVDLIGQRHDREALRWRLLDGFGAEAPQIIVGPAGKFGTLEFTRPWGAAPAIHATPLSQAVRLVWQGLRLSDADRSRPILLRASVRVVDLLRPLVAAALDPLAPMLRLETSNRIEAAYA